MTTSASIALSTPDFVPQKVEAELRLLTLAGSHNPLAQGGKLLRTIPGDGTAAWAIDGATTTFTRASVLPTALPSPVTFVLEAPTGKRLLELVLEVADYTSDWASDRVEIRIAAKGVSAQVAQTLAIVPTSYSWRLSGTATVTVAGDVLKLGFDLAQEEVATEFVDPAASTRLAFTADSSGAAQKAVIRLRRFKETVQPTS